MPSLTTSLTATRRCALKTASVPRTVHIIGYRGKPRLTAGEFTAWDATLLSTSGPRRADARRGELQQARTALAHRQRVSLLGEVAASLAHEIKQPIAAASIDAGSACTRSATIALMCRWRARPPDEWSRMRRGPTRSSSAPRALYKKDTTHRERVDINGVIREMVLLFQQEAGAPPSRFGPNSPRTSPTSWRIASSCSRCS